MQIMQSPISRKNKAMTLRSHCFSSNRNSFIWLIAYPPGPKAAYSSVSITWNQSLSFLLNRACDFVKGYTYNTLMASNQESLSIISFKVFIKKTAAIQIMKISTCIMNTTRNASKIYCREGRKEKSINLAFSEKENKQHIELTPK